MEEKVPMTALGNEALHNELRKLKFEDRPAIVAAIEEARGHGDLSENAEYHAAREQQSFISGDKVLFGATVKVLDLETEEEHTYQIVGQYEANLEKGRLSFISPIAKALIGKSKGDMIEFKTPKGEKSYEILDVQFI